MSLVATFLPHSRHVGVLLTAFAACMLLFAASFLPHYRFVVAMFFPHCCLYTAFAY